MLVLHTPTTALVHQLRQIGKNTLNISWKEGHRHSVDVKKLFHFRLLSWLMPTHLRLWNESEKPGLPVAPLFTGIPCFQDKRHQQ